MKSPSLFHSAFVIAVSLLILPVVLTGCGGGAAMRKYPVLLINKAGGAILVDVIGATASDLPEWEHYSVKRYFEPDNPKRKDADKVTFRVGEEENKTYVLEVTDAMWDTWERRGVDRLVILADLPRPEDDASMRKVLPLSPKNWKKGTLQLEVEIQVSGIRVLTPEALRK